MDQVVTLSVLWDRVRARRRGIVILVAVATILAGTLAFIMPPWYRAEAELLPPGEEESGIGISNLLRGVAVPGIRIPTEVTPADVFMVILQSRRIGERMVARFDLKTRYKCKFMADAIRTLHGHTRFKLTQAGTIQISVEDKNRQTAADMANAFMEYLDEFNRQSRMTKGRRTRLFIEARLGDLKVELVAAERRLAEYQAKNKTVALSPQMSSAVEQASAIYARRTMLQVRLGVIRSYSTGPSDEEIQIQQELAQLDQKMRELPVTGLELTRMVRDVRALEQVLALLTAQYEDARINEARDVVTIDILDAAVPPERKSRPRRLTMMMGAFMTSMILGVGVAAIRKGPSSTPLVSAAAD
jgi:tyrosine-protein kinase Etk/Wzc